MRSGRIFRWVAIACGCALAGCAAPSRGDAAPPTATPSSSLPAGSVVIGVDPARPTGRIAPGFVGLSLEPFDLNSTLLDPAVANLSGFLSALGPSRLRIGGTESGIYWQSDPSRPKPSWARLVVTDASFVRLAALMARTGWRVDLGVGLAHDDPANAAAEVADASLRLGPALASVEIGNEPDLYATKGLRPAAYGYDDYQVEIDAYRRAIAAAAPGVAIAGPDTARSPAVTDWLDRYVAHEHAHIAFVTQHGYATTHCRGARTSIAALLSAKTRARREAVFDALVESAQRFRVGARLDETNSTSCGGQAGVSDRFASALWVVDDLLDAASRGVAGANVHGFLEACAGYTPLCADRVTRQIRAQPVFYGMVLVHLVGAGRFLRVSTPAGSDLGAYAVRRADNSVAVVVVNRDADHARTVVIKGPGTRTARQLTLTAASLAAADATLGGARFEGDGSIAPATIAVPFGPAGYRVALRPGSVEVLTIPA